MCSRVGLYNFMGEAMCKSELKRKKERKDWCRISTYAVYYMEARDDLKSYNSRSA